MLGHDRASDYSLSTASVSEISRWRPPAGSVAQASTQAHCGIGTDATGDTVTVHPDHTQCRCQAKVSFKLPGSAASRSAVKPAQRLHA
eukprot:3746193-Rhodomonas_salina.3